MTQTSTSPLLVQNNYVSQILKRNATAQDLEQALRRIGETITMQSIDTKKPTTYRCIIMDVYLDDLKRLIIVLKPLRER